MHRSNIPKKREDKHQLKKDKEHVEFNKFMAELSKKDGFGEDIGSSSSTPSDGVKRLIFLLGFSYMINAVNSTPVRGLRRLKVSVGENVAYSDCKDPKATIAQIANQLPDSAPMFERVLKTENFQVQCVKQDQMDNTVAGTTAAQYVPRDNRIEYSAGKLLDDKYFAFSMHHEALHADTSRRHSTKHCNIEQLVEVEEFSIFKLFKNKPTFLKNQLQDKTPSSIWPPTEANLARLHDILKADKELNKVDELIKLHRKNFSNKLSAAEKLAYEEHLSALKGMLSFERTISIPADQAKQLELYLKKHDNLPEKFMMKNGVTYKNIKIIEAGVDQYYYQGTLNGDEVTSFLYNYHHAWITYDKLKNQGKDDLVAGAEGDVFLRMGAPNAAIEKYYPNLWQHLKNEEECCDKGIKNKCYPSNS